MGKIPGRAASPRPTGLAPPQTFPRLRTSGNVTHSRCSKSRIRPWFHWKHRKASTSIQRSTRRPKFTKYSENPLPWRLHKTSAEPRPSQRPRWAKGRPAGLPQAGRLNNCNTGTKPTANRLQEVIRAVVRKAAATWRHPQAGMPRGGQPAPLCSVSSRGFMWKLSTPTLPAFN